MIGQIRRQPVNLDISTLRVWIGVITGCREFLALKRPPILPLVFTSMDFHLAVRLVTSPSMLETSILGRPIDPVKPRRSRLGRPSQTYQE